nr:T9SS type A sorting domain-containing protein [uncultured Carboxylicivirga sp.]
MKTFTILWSLVLVLICGQLKAQVVYADFESTDMVFESWGDATFAKVANPTSDTDATNTSANVGEFSHAGNNWWTGIGASQRLASPIDFSVTPYFRMKVFASSPIYILFKLENFDDYNLNSEVGYQLTDDETNKWVELTFNFSEVTRTDLDKIVLYFDPEMKFSQAGTKYYFDDINASNSAPAGEFSLSPEEGATEIKVQDPLKLTANFALRMIDDSPISDPSSVLVLKKTDVNGADIPFTGYISNDQKSFSIVPDMFLDASTTYWYGVKEGTIEYSTDEEVTGISASFTTTANAFPQVYNIEDFDGNTKARVVETIGDPSPAYSIVSESDEGIGTSDNQVFKFEKKSSWGGWERIHLELMYPIEVTDGKAAFSMRIYSPKTTYLRFKLSNQKDDGGTFQELDADVNVANGWQTLYFEFSNLTAVDYSHILLFPAGGDGEELTYYIDDIKGPNVPMPDLNVDFLPADGATNGYSFSKMTITSNYEFKNLDHSAIADFTGKLALKKGGSTGSDIAYSASISADNKKITIIPVEQLEVGSTYYYGVVDNALIFEDNGENITGLSATFTVREANMAVYNDFDGNSLCLDDPNGVYSIGSSVENLWVSMDPDFINEYDNALEWNRGTENWGWEHVQFKLNNKINTSGDKIISVKVYSPKTTYVRLKLSNNDESVFYEVDANITAINTWETLYFDYSNIDLSQAEYNTLSFFIDGGNTDDAQKYYFDDLMGPVLGNATAIAKTHANKLKFYPNPVVDFLYLINTSQNVNYEVYSLSGALVKSGSINANKIDVSNLFKGVYLIKVDSQVTKFIKK